MESEYYKMQNFGVFLMVFAILLFLSVTASGMMLVVLVYGENPFSYNILKMEPIWVLWDQWKWWFDTRYVFQDPETYGQYIFDNNLQNFQLKLFSVTFAPIGGLFVLAFLFRAPLMDFRPFKEPESIHGDAKWAGEPAIKKAGLRSKEGMLLGEDKKGFLIADGFQHALLFAPTGSGKGVGFVIPNLLYWENSVVVHDIKLENWELTSGYRQEKLGQQVFLWNPASPDGISHCYNPLDWISPKPGQMVDDVQKIANLILPEQEFWQNEARSLFVGVVLYLCAVPEKVTSFGEVVRTMRSDDVVYNLAVVLDTIGKQIHPVAYMNIAAFLQKADKERSGVISTMNSSLELWANPIIDTATASSDFNVSDFKRKKTTVYVGLTPDNLTRLQPLMQVFYQQSTEFLCRKMPGEDEPFGVMFMMDEFPTLGEMEQFKTGIAYFRGYRVRLFLIIQDTEQLKGIYEESGMNSFLSNSTYRITFAANNMETANLISQLCGNKTVEQESLNKPKFFDLNPATRSVHATPTQRALLLPQEVIMLDRSEQILLIESSPPIKSKKILYYADPFFKKRLLPPTEVPVQEPYDPRKAEAAAAAPPPTDEGGGGGEVPAIEQTEELPPLPTGDDAPMPLEPVDMGLPPPPTLDDEDFSDLLPPEPELPDFGDLGLPPLPGEEPELPTEAPVAPVDEPMAETETFDTSFFDDEDDEDDEDDFDFDDLSWEEELARLEESIPDIGADEEQEEDYSALATGEEEEVSFAVPTEEPAFEAPVETPIEQPIVPEEPALEAPIEEEATFEPPVEETAVVPEEPTFEAPVEEAPVVPEEPVAEIPVEMPVVPEEPVPTSAIETAIEEEAGLSLDDIEMDMPMMPFEEPPSTGAPVDEIPVAEDDAEDEEIVTLEEEEEVDITPQAAPLDELPLETPPVAPPELELEDTGATDKTALDLPEVPLEETAPLETSESPAFPDFVEFNPLDELPTEEATVEAEAPVEEAPQVGLEEELADDDDDTAATTSAMPEMPDVPAPFIEEETEAPVEDQADEEAPVTMPEAVAEVEIPAEPASAPEVTPPPAPVQQEMAILPETEDEAPEDITFPDTSMVISHGAPLIHDKMEAFADHENAIEVGDMFAEDAPAPAITPEGPAEPAPAVEPEPAAPETPAESEPEEQPLPEIEEELPDDTAVPEATIAEPQPAPAEPAPTTPPAPAEGEEEGGDGFEFPDFPEVLPDEER